MSTFDVNEFKFEIKEDLFGLGYKRLDVGNLFNYNKNSSNSQNISESPATNLLFPMIPENQKTNKKGIGGHVIINSGI